MSRLFEALSGATAGHYEPGTIPPTSRPKVIAPTRIHVETPPERTNSMEGSTEVTREPIGTEEVQIEEAPKLTAMAAPAGRLVAITNPNSLGAEKFRALATRLDHLRQQNKLKSIQVTSSVVHEGKSFVAANLALTLATHSGAKTLLIEGDLHRATLASLFGLCELRGLTHWWAGRDDEITHYVQQFNGMPLWFLPAGNACDQPSEILRSARLATAFAQLADTFDWIVVDSTPMLPIIDANLWSRLVDGTLLVVREGMAPVKALKKGLQALDHPKLIGVVINESSETEAGRYEAQYYGAGRNPERATRRRHLM